MENPGVGRLKWGINMDKQAIEIVKNYKGMARSIAGDEKDDAEEILAYAISGCSVGKGNDLAKALYEKYRWKVVI